jgi:cation:H+ antiporter
MAQVLRMMLLSGGAVVIAGILLGRSADLIADRTGLGEMWTGWVLLAAATSLPEFVTDVSAVRLDAANLAAGDLFGSSLTNMAILAVLALVSSGRNGIRVVREAARIVEGEGSPSLHSAWLAILLTALGTIFTLVHTNLSIFGLRPQSVTLLFIWITGTRLLFSRPQAYPNATGVMVRESISICLHAYPSVVNREVLLTRG